MLLAPGGAAERDRNSNPIPKFPIRSNERPSSRSSAFLHKLKSDLASLSPTPNPPESGGIPRSPGPMTTAGEEAAAAGEELEPLFCYKRVQPTIDFRFDDSDLEKADIFKHCNKRPRVNAAATEEEGKPDEKAATAKAVDVDVDWLLPPPPKAAFKPSAEEDNALRELRLKRQELAKWAESVHDILQDLDATARTEVVSKEQPEQIIIDDEPEPQVEKVREKIVISIQDKNARQQFRVFKDEKFDKLLKVYAKKAKLNPSDLAFVFDGEKVNLSSTPEDLDLEDDDMIEVRHKRH